MRNARIGAIIYPGYVLQHLLSNDGKGGSLFIFDGMVERVANVAGDGYYEVRRENRQVKIPQHTFFIHRPWLVARSYGRNVGPVVFRVVTSRCCGDGKSVWGGGGSLRASGVGLRWSRGWSSIRIH
jgi:hypothetical protein